MKLYLLRHAQTLHNKEGINGSQTPSPLSEEGKKLSQDIIPILKKYQFDVVIVSPLHRTLETIKPFLDSLPDEKKPGVVVDELTIERDLGKLTGTRKGEIGKYKEQHNITTDPISWIPPKGESILDVRERAIRFFDLLKKNHREQSILICGHQNFLRNLELLIISRPVTDFYSDNPPRMENGEIREYDIEV